MILFLFSGTLVACNDDDDYSLGKFWISYGTIEMNGKSQSAGYTIRLDDESELLIVSNLIPYVAVENGQRVIANYTILGEVEEDRATNSSTVFRKQYYIRLNGLTDVLSKAPVRQSFILEDEEVREDSIGNDPIRVVKASFGGKYLNISFEVPMQPTYGGTSSVKHFINLIHDDTQIRNDSVFLTLRHNGYEDVPTSGNSSSFVWGFGLVSFDISSILPEGQNSIAVKLIWTEYGESLDDRETKSDTGTFTYGGSSQQSASTGRDGLNSSQSPVESMKDRITTVVR